MHLETKEATYFYFKADALKREIIYSTERNAPVNTVTLTAAQAFEIIALNKNGVKPDSLILDDDGKKTASPFGDLLNQDAINRFDKKKKKKKKKGGGDKQAPKPAQDNAPAPKNKPEGQNAERQPRPPRPAGQQRNEKKTFRPRRPKQDNAQQDNNGQNARNNKADE